MLSIMTIKNGLRKGLITTWELALVMVPVYLIVTLLGETPVMDWISRAAQPLMGMMGLPGEAAGALVIGNFINQYAAIGAMAAIPMSAREVTVLSLVLLICHNILVETAVSKKTGIKVRSLVLVRVLGGLAAGIILNLAWPGWL
ncbi:nucleoside recognition domain-containing protein [Phosphitispora fastidiosa]|uniref:nucleoside recognition domain-containing protein n=1 Tax=Phosphitispora fastidiosa TaxID=2837202 RepID=UPI001E4FEC55|nr:nucleoside recognition domain-containing protein [Phosphitispora fastidiosa]MBU7006114.1 hypothetical protein [Phosphitispora fastidiosa]